MADGFTHLDDEGNARMVDVAAKDVTARVATAEAIVAMSPDVKAATLRRRATQGRCPRRGAGRRNHGGQADLAR